MPRLFSDLLSGSGGRYYYHLTTAPGGITNAAPATITLVYTAATIQEQSTVFRTPATAALTLLGYAPLADVRLEPAQAALSIGASVPGKAMSITITNAITMDYGTLPDNAPTIVFIQTIAPDRATLTLNYPATNLTQGGNIGFVSPSLATITLTGYSPTLLFFQAGTVATLSLSGLAPTLVKLLTIQADVGSIIFQGPDQVLSLPFHWLEDDLTPTPTWIDDPRA